MSGTVLSRRRMCTSGMICRTSESSAVDMVFDGKRTAGADMTTR